MPRPSVKPTVSLGSTIGALKLPSLNRTKPRTTALESMYSPTMSPLSLIFCGSGEFRCDQFACYLVRNQRQHLTLRKRSSYPGAFHHRRILPQPCETDARTSNPTARRSSASKCRNKNDADEGDA